MTWWYCHCASIRRFDDNIQQHWVLSWIASSNSHCSRDYLLQTKEIAIAIAHYVPTHDRLSSSIWICERLSSCMRLFEYTNEHARFSSTIHMSCLTHSLVGWHNLTHKRFGVYKESPKRTVHEFTCSLGNYLRISDNVLCNGNNNGRQSKHELDFY